MERERERESVIVCVCVRERGGRNERETPSLLLIEPVQRKLFN